MSRFSFTTAPITAVASTGATVTTGTCFFYRRRDGINFLVTNWHVVTGRSPLAPRHSVTGLVPTHAKLKLHQNIGPDQFSISRKIDVQLPINDDNGEKPAWLEHPARRYEVDVVVLPIPDNGLSTSATFAFLDEDPELERDYGPEPMGDAFVLGYPWGHSSGDGVMPIYKRGSVASDTRLNHGGLPRFLIDCRTAPGMSGAPVLCSRSGVWAPSGKFDGTAKLGTVINFAGVYSGRLTPLSDDPREADAISELGMVWKKSALDEIVDQGAGGTRLSEV